MNRAFEQREVLLNNIDYFITLFKVPTGENFCHKHFISL